jgi:hypothetical protein
MSQPRASSPKDVAAPDDKARPLNDAVQGPRCWRCGLPGDLANPVTKDVNNWPLHFHCRVRLGEELNRWRRG